MFVLLLLLLLLLLLQQQLLLFFRFYFSVAAAVMVSSSSVVVVVAATVVIRVLLHITYIHLPGNNNTVDFAIWLWLWWRAGGIQIASQTPPPLEGTALARCLWQGALLGGGGGGV